MASLQVEAAERTFDVTEAFLLLTLTLIQKGVHTATLQVCTGFIRTQICYTQD